LLQFGDHITKARIISSGNTHCLLLTNDVGDVIAVKSGFSSGYGGTGPTCFSYVLKILYLHGVEIDECEVDEGLIERIDYSALTVEDLEEIETAKPIRPSRWSDYIREMHYESASDKTIWTEFPPVIPFAVIDPRIIDLALSFWDSPDDKLLKGYRRLEEAVRNRTGLDDHGEKLFSRAFLHADAKLGWTEIDESERIGRAQFFASTFKAYRNPRAHRELKSNSHNQLTELLLLNHLFRLEKEASPNTTRDGEHDAG
jgi:hypothetical protein